MSFIVGERHTDTSFLVAVLHNPKSAARRAALEALRKRVRIDLVESGPGPEHEFNGRRWLDALNLARRLGCLHVVFLDDDVIVCDRFAERCEKIIAARPAEVIALHTSLPSARAAFDVGEHWLTSLDGVLGPANIWPVRVLEAFLAWRSSSALKPGTVEASGRFGSDALAGMFCAEMDRRVFHPIPTIVMHDLSLETSFAGNEATPGRQTTCNFSEVPLPDNWEQSSPVRHTGGWFLGMPGLRAAYCKPSAQEPQITDTGVWFGEDVAQHHACDPGLAEWLGGFFDPARQVFDLGCGDGAYLAMLARKGFTKLLGIDGTTLPDRLFDRIVAHDLTVPIEVHEAARGDVLCLEVCEHVPAEYEGRLLDNIVGACGEHGRVVLSWAMRGQHGHGHVNCRDTAEVIALFEARGFDFLERETREARAAARTLPWFASTILIFQRRSSAQTTQPGSPALPPIEDPK